MEKQIWFYVGLMIILIIGNAAQLNKMKRGILNWMQIIIYAATIVWFVIMIFKGLSSYFYFVTTLAFWFCLLIEVWQVARKQGKISFLDIIFILVTAIAPVLSTAILAGFFA